MEGISEPVAGEHFLCPGGSWEPALGENRAPAARRGEVKAAEDVVPTGTAGLGPVQSTAIDVSDSPRLGCRSQGGAMVFVGIDWSEEHNEVEIQSAQGR